MSGTIEKTIRPMISEVLEHPRAVRASAVALGLFLLITVLVQLRLLAGFDMAMARANQGMVGRWMDLWSAGTSIALSAEMSALYAVVASLLLRRAGFGPWALAPFAFLLILPLEVGMKLTVTQPNVHREFIRPAFYPFFSMTLNGSFPSGHAIRSAFLCTFVGVLLWQTRQPMARPAVLLLVPLMVMLGVGRIYMGYHWASDVVAGMLLGSSVALILAVPIAERMSGRRKEARRTPQNRTDAVAGPLKK